MTRYSPSLLPASQPQDLPSPTDGLPRWFWSVALLMGAGMSVLGLVFVVSAFVFTSALEAFSLVVAGYGLIAMTLGLGLLVAGLRTLRGRPPRLFHAKWTWLFFFLLSIAVGTIGAFLPQSIQGQPIFAPIYDAMIILPGLFLLSLVTRSAGPEGGLSIRRLLLLLTGGTATILVAVPVEIAGLIASGAIGAIATSLLPGGSTEIDRLMNLAQQWAEHPPTDPSDLVGLVSSPLVIITLVLSLAVIAPLVEEFGKTLVMGVIGIWVKPSVLMSFVWGVACGLGFAWLEGVSNGAIGIGDMTGWLGSAGVRFLATAMHCTASGLLGLGWGVFWRGRRWALPVAYAGAVMLHGFWNLNVVLSVGGLALSSTNAAVGGALATFGVLFESLLIAISLTSLVGIPLILRRSVASAARG